MLRLRLSMTQPRLLLTRLKFRTHPSVTYDSGVDERLWYNPVVTKITGPFTYDDHNGLASSSRTAEKERNQDTKIMKTLIISLVALLLGFLLAMHPANAQTCRPGVSFVADVTVPDDTVYQPGSPFQKIWKLRNSGTCEWNDNYGVVFVGGDPLSAESPQVLGRTIAVGETADIGVVMRAPAQPGVYTSHWQMQDDTGKRFGDPFYVRIQVKTIQEPVAEITAPKSGATIAGQVPIIGSAVHPAFDYYKLEAGPGDNPTDDQMALITPLLHDQVLKGQLAVWDTTALGDGRYSLRLRVVQLDGNYQEFWVPNLTINNTAPPTPTRRPPTATPTEQVMETTIALPVETATPEPEDLGFSGGLVRQTPVQMATELPTLAPLPTATFTPLPTSTPTPLPTATFTPSPTNTSTPLPTATSTVPPTAATLPVEPAAIPPVTALFENSDWGITFLYPEGWNIEDQSDESFLGVYGGGSVEALTMFSGGDFPGEITEAVFMVVGGLATDLPEEVPTPDATGHVPSSAVLESFTVMLSDSAAASDVKLTQAGTIQPFKTAELEGSLAELAVGDQKGRMYLVAFTPDERAMILVVAVPEAQRLAGRKLVEDMAASLRIKTRITTAVPLATETPLPPMVSPTPVITPAGGGFGFTLPTEEETPTVTPPSAPTAISAGGGFGFTTEMPPATLLSTPLAPPTKAPPKPGVGLEVTSYSIYTDTYGYVFVVGEAANVGSVPLRSPEITLSLLDEQGNKVGDGGYNMIYLDIVPVGDKYPFRFSIDQAIQGWKNLDFEVKAEPYDREKSYFKVHEAFLVLNTVAHDALDEYDSFSLTGKVKNVGDVAAASVRVAVIAYDAREQVIDTNSIMLPMDVILPNEAIPFDISLYGLAETPFAYEFIVQGREETNLPAKQAQTPFHVKNYAHYSDSLGRLNIVGEAINDGTVVATAIKIVAAMLDENGDVLAVSTSNWNGLELVPPGGQYPFGFQFGDEAKDWKQVEIHIQAQPYDPAATYFKPHGGLKLLGLSGAVPESSWGGYKISGQVVNDGDAAANWIKIVAIAYDANGAVIDVGSATPKLDGDLQPGASAPFDLEFHGLKNEPASYQAFVEGREAKQ